MNDFQEYRETYEKMLLNRNVSAWRSKICAMENDLEKARSILAEFESPFRFQMGQAEERIRQSVLESGNSVSVHGVIASYRKGRANTSWKSVAMEYSPPDELVKKFTNYSQPSVQIKIDEV